LFTAHGSTDLAIRGVAFATEGVENFMLGTMKTDNQDFISKLEGHAIQGLAGKKLSANLTLHAYSTLLQAPPKIMPAESLKFGVR
jgi:hypothetical protein